ncbi:CUB and sushi domain-containing protein, partial [Biomphalaria pfeifferi]
MFRLCFTILAIGLLSASIPKAVLGLSDVYGSSFLFALPTNNQSMTVVHLILTTLSFNQVKVIFEDYWTKDKIYEQFIISREIRKHFALNESASTSLITYHLKGTDAFSLTVIAENLFEDNRSLSSFQAVPVAGWSNEYIVMTLPFHPSIIIVTIFDNKISITVRSSAFQFHVLDKLNGNQKKALNVLIKSYNSYSIDACGIGKADLRDLHGTVIKGQYTFGVIIGSCYTEINSTPCKSGEKNSDIYQTTDMITEMHLPVESFGLDFVVFGLPSARGSGHHFIMASREQTEVSMSGPAIETQKWNLSEKGEVTQIPEVWQPMLLLSDKPISVYFILLSSCDDATEALGGALSLILPVSLHMDAYYWHTQSLEDHVTHYLFYLWRKEESNVILELDDVVIRRYLRNVSYIPTFMFTWEAGEVEISEGPHQFFSRSGVKFGVYLYGFGDTVAYMHLAGFISRNSLDCVANGVPEPGDLIDNDCDGWIDEERNDGTDDDHDGLVDEDLLPLPPRSGNWGEWQPWWCTHCTSNVLSRKRQCNTPPPTRGGLYCYGDENSSIAGDCKEICEMSHGSWGPWSDWTCTKDCSFLSGIRIRTCSNPAPSRNGSHCEGAHILEREDSQCIRQCTK